VRQDVEQAARDGGEVVRLALHRKKGSHEKRERIVERVIHDSHADLACGQRSKALRLFLEPEQCGLVEGRAAGQVAARNRCVEQVEQLLVVSGGSGMSWSPLAGDSSE
jgi:hypothetical protein